MSEHPVRRAPHAAARFARRAAFSCALLAGVGLALAAGSAVAAHLPAGTPIGRLKTDTKEIALSFDDGPQATPVLDTLLEVLASRHAHATFFVIGSELAAHPELAARLRDAGHELGNHTWSHPRLDSLPLPRVRAEIASTDSLLRKLHVRGRILFRPPYGALSEAVVAELKRRHRIVTLFDVDPSNDFPALTDPDSIAAKTVDWLGPGSILVLHPWYGNDGPALALLPRVLDWLERLGYRIVTVSELLKLEHATVEPSEYHEIME
jgi:peptidoglycan/xylan/chitin deacetylase (PgdA/CDA1 family)